MRSNGPSRPNPYKLLAELSDDAADRPGGYGVPSEPDPEPDDEPAPAAPRSRRRFGWLRLSVKAVVGVTVLAVILTLADRCLVMYAEQKAREHLKKALKLNAAPEVDIHGFPFLTQVAGKSLHEVDVTVPDIAADRVTIAGVHAKAYDVDFTTGGRGAVPTSVSAALINRMRGDVLVSFDDLDRELGSSQVTFKKNGPHGVRVDGKVPVAGRELRMRAVGEIRRAGSRGVDVEVGNMRLGLSGLATFRPGQGKDDGLRLTREAADRVSRDVGRAKALLSVDSLASRLGVTPALAERAADDDRVVRRITGRSDFAPKVMRLNLVDLAVDHPEVLRKVGIDPDLAESVTKLTKPDLSDRLSLSFRLPENVPGSLRIEDVRVEKDGIRAELSGRNMSFGTG